VSGWTPRWPPSVPAARASSRSSPATSSSRRSSGSRRGRSDTPRGARQARGRARPHRPREPSTGSPAVAITLASGLVGLLLSLNAGAFAVALFFCAVSLAALPLAVGDRPGGRSLRFALLGGLMAALGLALVLVPS
jgi:hypothetical protein